ncbi:50S ribosomal protein L22 [Patescibacteria group bacterium]|nr:50S ribosomal protein L22 [Patescibacteria group bacterium]
MRVKAISKYLKISPKKMRLVANMIRGMKVDQAVDHLRFIPKKASPMILKILQSAIANAEHNFNLKKENLLIKEIFIDGGPMIKRWRARAFGRAAMIRRRSSHCSIILEEKEPGLVTQSKKTKLKEPTLVKGVPKEDTPSQPVSPQKFDIKKQEFSKTEEPEIFDARRKGKHRSKQHLDRLKRKASKGGLKRFFRRKSI